jgi:arsenate reductase-like glutaredoxin family protein
MHLSPVQLASQGSFVKIKWDKLTVKDITECDERGVTLLHHAASAGLMANIPKHLQDKKYWTPTPNGTTIYMLSLQRPNPNWWFDKNDLTEEEIIKKNNMGESFLSLAVQLSFHNIEKLIPKESLTQKALSQDYKEGDKIIHIMAKHNVIQNLPKSVLNESLLSLKGKNGDTVYHHQASIGRIKDFPKRVLTKTTLTLENDKGLTPLFSMALNEPEMIPKELLTPEFLHVKRKGQTPLHCWVQGEFWMNVPLELITKKSLKVKTRHSILFSIVEQYERNKTWYKNDKIVSDKINKLFSKALNLGDVQSLRDIRKDMLARESAHPLEIEPRVSSLIQKELGKRTILSVLNKKEACIDI